MLELEVFIRELLAVDRLAAAACSHSYVSCGFTMKGIAANELTVALGEIATLDHEGLDDTMEGGALITESLLASCQSTERSPESASTTHCVRPVGRLTGSSPQSGGSLVPSQSSAELRRGRLGAYLGDGLAIKTDHNSSQVLITVSDVEVDLKG